MLRSLAKLFGRGDGHVAEDEAAREHSVRLATALLLIEVARADYTEELTEEEAILELLRQFFALSDEDVALLADKARAESDHAASLQGFTRQLNEALELSEKHRIVEMLWRVAFADERLSKYEDGLVRKIADLLYVPHRDLIRIRNQVRPH
jgi:uncharacterized tellurite resistance protein B-like protein